MSSISSALPAGLQALTAALPALSNTPTSVLQGASPASLAALSTSSVQLQQAQELFPTGGTDTVSLSNQALSVLSGLSGVPGDTSTQTLLQQVQTLFSAPASGASTTEDSLSLSQPALQALTQLQPAPTSHSGSG